MNDNAAHGLTGLTLKSGWYVLKKLPKLDNQTGSFFSVPYLVEKDGQKCFLKAFDFARFVAISSEENVIDILSEMLTAYRYERDLSEHCKKGHASKIAFVKEAGEEQVQGYTITNVPYLIFDLADGDIRKVFAISENLDYAWRLKSLHDVAVGLKQLHSLEVSHQDLKPSNVLVFAKTECKIGDLGRSICRALDGPYNKDIFSGDVTYAPPEVMYGYYENDWLKRVFATDCYLLGSLIVFYFIGIGMTALLRKYIPSEFSWESWRGELGPVIPYIESGFARSLDEFESNIARDDIRQELRFLVEQLCNPFPDKRGHPKSINFSGNNYNLERFITILARLQRHVETYII